MSDNRSFIDAIIDDDSETFDRLVEDRAARVAAQMIEQRAQESAVLDAHMKRLPELSDPESEISRLTRRHVQEMMSGPRYESFSKLDIAERAIERAEVEMMRAGKINPRKISPGHTDSRADSPGSREPHDQSSIRLSEDQRRYAERMGLKVEEVERLHRARVEWERGWRPGR